MLKNFATKLRLYQSLTRNYSDQIEIEARQLQFPPKYQVPRQAWLENMDTIDERKLGILDLHPEVFAVTPRIDIIAMNKRWQAVYRKINWNHTKTQPEVRGGGKKPWPQKGLGTYSVRFVVDLVKCNFRKGSCQLDQKSAVPWRWRRSRTALPNNTLLHVALLRAASWPYQHAIGQARAR